MLFCSGFRWKTRNEVTVSLALTLRRHAEKDIILVILGMAPLSANMDKIEKDEPENINFNVEIWIA